MRFRTPSFAAWSAGLPRRGPGATTSNFVLRCWHPWFRLTGAAAFASSLAFAPAALAADSLSATRGSIVEKSHAIDLTISRGHVHMRVVREVTNRGERHDQATFHLYLPDGAVATGLRTRGVQDGKPVWYEGELLEAELAARRYRELTGIGGYYPKDPALLSWRQQGHLALQVFPCPPQDDKGIGYDLDLPTKWIDGREQLELDAMGLASQAAVATLRTDVPGGRIFVDGRDVPTGTTIQLDAAHTIELQPPNVFGAVDARLAAVAFGVERNLVALRFDAPKQLAEVPQGASVVVAIDASRSLDPDDVGAEMRAAHAYLAHFEGRDARVALVAYDRRARDLTRGFVSVREARALLDGPPLARGNGSAVDEAMARASTLLATAPSGKAKRVVVLGDLNTRHALMPSRIAPPPGAVVHVSTVSSSDHHPYVTRDDSGAWTALPRATGGLLFGASAPSRPLAGAEERAALEATYLEWARPVRIERMKWRLAGERAADGAGPGVLPEGKGIEHLAVRAKLPASATLSGELWSRPFAHTVHASKSEGKLWSALVFGTSLMNDMTEREQNLLARAGGAVSPVTSYLAIEPGVRPSTEGLEEGQGFGSGAGRLGGSHRSKPPTIRMGSVQPPDYQGIFAALMRDAVKTCRADGHTTIDVETTIAEVVDVAVVVTGDSKDGGRAACVREAAWAVDLPSEFTPRHLDLKVVL